MLKGLYPNFESFWERKNSTVKMFFKGYNFFIFFKFEKSGFVHANWPFKNVNIIPE